MDSLDAPPVLADRRPFDLFADAEAVYLTVQDNQLSRDGSRHMILPPANRRLSIQQRRAIEGALSIASYVGANQRLSCSGPYVELNYSQDGASVGRVALVEVCETASVSAGEGEAAAPYYPEMRPGSDFTRVEVDWSQLNAALVELGYQRSPPPDATSAQL
ncbi:hypothetical protein Q0812_07090 [Brevundimonas sp. 2R-24]|uniref:Uncharacterized protein n=1 Tax=Peiella sedimenti TaxID=3061083 RepID=A0ABT8SL23_9CAUL|nr:hypothetical protein [Caulobacteraceae bacterium XZ-24]